ncbi:MAG: choice-of-anchor I family protein [Flavobacteriales bacterium]|nr:choice-of-anchor I family protein [Flavobacteriales bacterium]
MRKILLPVPLIALALVGHAQVTLTPIGSYQSGGFEGSATEIVAYDAVNFQLFSTNGATGNIDIIDITDPTTPVYVSSIDLSAYGSGANSVALMNGVVAAAVEASNPQNNGSVVFFDLQGTFLAQVTVGAMPDMIMFSPDGSKVLTANEGEPDTENLVDPLGSISIVDISGGAANVVQNDVTTLDFTAYNSLPIDPAIRIFGNNGASSVAQDLEPEYIAVSADSETAFVTMQENNALAVIDLSDNTITALVALGFKDHSLAANALDASDRDDVVNIATYDNLYGMYQPDAIKAYSYSGSTFIVSANEGDSRDYNAYSEEERVKNLTLDPTAFPDAAALQADEVIGRLTVTTSKGDNDNDGDYDELYAFGARSFSIWDATGALVYDSGDDFEQYFAQNYPLQFNSDHTDNDSFDNRSDNKGPEPEALEVISYMGRTIAFIGLERQGGVMVYDITDPSAVMFLAYATDRDFTQVADATSRGLGPEDIKFVPVALSPINENLLLVTNEVSGSISIYTVEGLPSAPQDPMVITEIMYNPPEADTDSLEFVELYNPSANTIDISGYYFREGFDYTFPQGTIVAGNGFVIVASDSVVFENAFGIPAFEWSNSDALSNSGEDIVLANSFGLQIDSVNYDDAGLWPSEADGDGYSLVLCDVNADNNDPANWQLANVATGIIVNSLEVYADPGALSSCMTVGKDEIIVTTFTVYPNPSANGLFETSEAVTGAVYSITGVKVADMNNARKMDLSMQPAGMYVVRTINGDVVRLTR